MALPSATSASAPAAPPSARRSGWATCRPCTRDSSPSNVPCGAEKRLQGVINVSKASWTFLRLPYDVPVQYLSLDELQGWPSKSSFSPFQCLKWDLKHSTTTELINIVKSCSEYLYVICWRLLTTTISRWWSQLSAVLLLFELWLFVPFTFPVSLIRPYKLDIVS